MKKLYKCLECKKYLQIESYDLYREYRNVDLNILSGPIECYYHKVCRNCYKILILLNGAKLRAKKRNLEFDLKFKDIKIPDRCPILQIPLKNNKGGVGNNSPTIDRIDNSRGYTKDNILVISARANRIKNDSTLDELVAITEFYKNFHKK